MSHHQCVPSWELDDPLLHHPEEHHTPLPSSTAATSANYDVTELTWNGHLITTLGKPIPPRHPPSASPPVTNPAGGTLECIVDQARSGAHHPAADAMVPSSDAAAARTNCTSEGSATPAAGKRKTAPSPSQPSAGDEEEEEEEEEGGGGGGGGSPETEKGRRLGVEEHHSVSHTLRRSHSQRSGMGERGITSISAKRGREAAVHNQSERKRRDRINQKLKTLQKLLPNSSKTDKASMLEEVIEYLKLLQAQVQMMSRMNTIPTMMLPIAMQHQQLQLSMIAQMAQITRMGMSLGMIEPSLLNPAPPPPILHPSTFLPLPSTASGGRVLPDMFSAFMGCPAQQQPMNSEAYSRMAILYQQLYQQTLGSNQKT